MVGVNSGAKIDIFRRVGITVLFLLLILFSRLGFYVELLLSIVVLIFLFFWVPRGREKVWIVPVFLLIWIGLKVFNSHYVIADGTPDAYRYKIYYQDFHYRGYEYIREAIGSLFSSRIYDTSSYSVIAVFFYPLIDVFFKGNVDLGFRVLNFIFACLTAIYSCMSVRVFRADPRLALCFVLWLISPVVVFHYDVYSKDIFSSLLCMMSVFFLGKKNILASVVFFVLATMLRPYSVAVIFIYYVILSGHIKVVFYAALASAVLCLLFSGVSGLLNAIIVSFYMPLSPNIFGLRVERIDYFPMYIESLIVFLGFLFVIRASFSAYYRKRFLYPILGGMAIYGCVMALLGKYSSDYHDYDYGVGVMGNNALRKKLAIIPLYYYLIATAIVHLRVRVKVLGMRSLNYRGVKFDSS